MTGDIRWILPQLFFTALQMLEVAYMIYAGRWFLPALILLLFLAASVSLGMTLRRQRLKVMAMVNECRLTPLVWEGWVRAVSSHRLLPGDIMVLRQGKAVCDMVLLQGSCLVMESMLSGEVGHPPHQTLHVPSYSEPAVPSTALSGCVCMGLACGCAA